MFNKENAMSKEMSKSQKRMAAIFLALMGIFGTIMALEDRQYMNQEQTQQTAESQAEAGVTAD